MPRRVCGGNLAAQAGVAFGDDWVAEADDEDAQVQEALAHRDRLGGVVDDDGADGGRAGQHIKPRSFQFRAGVLDVVFQPLHALRLAQGYFDCFACARGDGDGEGVAEERGAAALDDEVDYLLACGDEAARAAAEGFAERAGEDVDAGLGTPAFQAGRIGVSGDGRHVGCASVAGSESRGTQRLSTQVINHAPMLMRTAPEFAHDAVAVAVVDDEHRVVLVAEFSHGGKICDGAFHAEDAVGHDPDLACDFLVGFRGVERGAKAAFAFEAVVGVDGFVHALLDRCREANAVDDAGVVEFVADDDVARLAERRENGFVCGPRGDERVTRLGAHVTSDALLEFPVRRERAADEADAGSPRAVVAQGFVARFDDFGVVGEAEVVVGAETEDLLRRAVPHERDLGVHGALDGLEFFPEAVFFELGEE